MNWRCAFIRDIQMGGFQAEGVAEMERLADKILSHNKFVSLAYSAKVRAVYAECGLLPGMSAVNPGYDGRSLEADMHPCFADP